MARNHRGQFRRGGTQKPFHGEFPADVPAARPSAAFALILELGGRAKAGEMTPAEYGRALDAVKMAERRAIMAGRVATEADLRGALVESAA